MPLKESRISIAYSTSQGNRFDCRRLEAEARASTVVARGYRRVDVISKY